MWNPRRAGTLNRALAVNRIACRLSLRDRNLGGATLRPLRLPVIEAKKLRYATIGAMTDTNEIPVADLRQNLAEVLNDTAVHARITYVTRNGRRIAAIVPVPVAEQIDKPRG